jgi:hypothetical protein
MSSPQFALLQLRVVSEADPAALVRVLQHFQNLNFVPRRMVAECSTAGEFHVCVDVFGLTEDRMTLITEKIKQAPFVLNAYWCRV